MSLCSNLEISLASFSLSLSQTNTHTHTLFLSPIAVWPVKGAGAGEDRKLVAAVILFSQRHCEQQQQQQLSLFIFLALWQLVRYVNTNLFLFFYGKKIPLPSLHWPWISNSLSCCCPTLDILTTILRKCNSTVNTKHGIPCMNHKVNKLGFTLSQKQWWNYWFPDTKLV